MDGIHALAHWDLVIDVFHSVPNRTDGHKREPHKNPSAVIKPNMHNAIPIKHTNLIPTNIDHIPSTTTHSGSSAMLYVFEDNEAVIKMIVKSGSPTMVHVSRTHRVALDWLFDKISLDPKIQIRCSDSKHQLADMLTHGNFTRDECNNLLHLLITSHFSSTCCTKNFSFDKLLHNGEEDSKSKRRRKSCVQGATSSDEHVLFLYCDKFLRRIESNCISKSGDADSFGKPDSRMSFEPSSFDAASTSRVRLKDAYIGGLMEEQRGDPSHQEEGNSEDSDNPAAGTWYFKGDSVAQNNKVWVKQTPCTRSQFFS